jgi:hypothetical protein
MKTRLGFRFVQGNRWQRPDQVLNKEQAESMKVDEVTHVDDSRYDSMTDEEREKYYVQPSLKTKIVKALVPAPPATTSTVHASRR